jgi:hypothetical protein
VKERDAKKEMVEMSSTGSWRRWQDWVSLVAGVVLALSPLRVNVDTRGTWAMALIGAAIGVVALIALAAPGAYLDEGIGIVLGIAAFIAPWLFTFTAVTVAAWTAWLVGIIVAGMTLTALPVSRKIHQHQPTAA